MTPVDFLKSLLPTFTKDRLTQDLVVTREEFENHVEPAYTEFKKNFKDYKLSAPALNAYQTRFNNTVEFKYSGNWVVAMWDNALKHLPSKLTVTETMLEEGKTGDFARAAMTARDLNATQMAEVLSFATRYARRFLNFIIQTELNHLEQKEELSGMTKGEVMWLNDGFSAFLVVINFLTLKKATVEEMIDAIPDVLVNEANIRDVKAVSGDALDPFRFGFIPVKLNPIYHLGMRVAEYQAARYHEAQAEHQALSTKILYLRKRADGKNDARLEAVIEKYDAALAKKSYEIAKMEEKYGMGK